MSSITEVGIQAQGPLADIFKIFSYLWIIILPPLLWYLFQSLWRPHAWMHFGRKQKKILLEIIPPRDVEQSPLPMESFFSGLAGAEKSFTTAEEWIDGEYPTPFSLELVSTEGTVHMYIRIWEQTRKAVESNLYALYPGVEIVEADDYTKKIPKTVPNKDWNIWGTDFITTRSAAFPIRTYKHFEESVTGKMIDPLASMFELMSQARPGEHMWLQYIITATPPSWNRTTGEELIEEYLEKITKKGDKENDQPIDFQLTPGQREVLKAMHEKISKTMFKVKMRYVYVSRRAIHDKDTGVSGFVGTVKQFNDSVLNNVKPEGETKTKTSYFRVESRLKRRQRDVFHKYVKRDREPYDNLFIFNTEELATVFHIPDMSVIAPTLARVAAKRGSAPMNLPIEL